VAAKKIEVKINLLCFASHWGRKISKLSFSEFEYLRASSVSGQNILKISSVMPSAITNAIPS
jgi:hypothetical protein